MQSRFTSCAQEFDAFSHAFRFRLPNGEKEYRSWKGVCLTVILATALSFYGVMQWIKLQLYDETDIMVSSRDAYFESDFVFSNGLQYAFGITAYDSNPDSIEDPSIGVLKAYYKTWGLTEDDDSVLFEELPTRNCTEAEFHINGKSDPDSPFFKPHKNSKEDL